jgi:hypothetical protein
VFLKGGKVDEVAIQYARWHPVLDCLLCVGRGRPNDPSYFLENALHIRWKAGNVFIDG